MKSTHKFAIMLLITGAGMPSSAFSQLTIPPNPSPVEVAQATALKLCSDPWITLAVAVGKATEHGGKETPGVVNGTGVACECNPNLYGYTNGHPAPTGHWRNYAELMASVLSYRRCTGGNGNYTCTFDPPVNRATCHAGPEHIAANPTALCGQVHNTTDNLTADIKFTLREGPGLPGAGFAGHVSIGVKPNYLIGTGDFTGTSVNGVCTGTVHANSAQIQGPWVFNAQCQPGSFSNGTYHIRSGNVDQQGKFSAKACAP